MPLFIIVILLAVAKEILQKPVEIRRDALSRIKERGELIALTDQNSLDYFIYRGEPMGYQQLRRNLSAWLPGNGHNSLRKDNRKS